MPAMQKIIEFGVKLKNEAGNTLKQLNKDFSLLDKGIKLASTSIKAIPAVVAFSVVSMIKLDNDLKRAQFRYKSIGQDVEGFQKSLMHSAASSSVASDVLWKVSMGLKEAGMRSSFTDKKIIDLSSTIYKFGEVTGVSIETLTEMTSELSKFGVDAGPVLQNMATLTSRFNLTHKEMESIVKTTKDSIVSMNLYGKTLDISGDKLTRFTAKITAFQGAMLDAKVSTEVVAGLMAKMTDPEVYMENYSAMAMLGFSINDVNEAMEGNLVGSENMIRSLAKWGRIIKQNPMLAGAYAKMVGVPAKELIKIANQEEQMIKNLADPKTTKTLNQMWENMGNGLERMYRAFVKFSTALLVTFRPVTMILSKLFEAVGWTIEKLAWGLEQIMDNQLVALPVSIALIVGAFSVLKIMFGDTIRRIWEGVAAFFALDNEAKGVFVSEKLLGKEAIATSASLEAQTAIMAAKSLVAKDLARSLMAVAIAEGAIRGGKGGFGQGLGNMVMQGGNMLPEMKMLPGKNMIPETNPARLLPGPAGSIKPQALLPGVEKGAMWGGQKALGGAGMVGFAKMNAWVQGATALVTLMSAAMQKDKNQSWGKVAIKGLHDAGPSLISLGLMAIPGVGPALSVAAGLALPLIWDKIWSFLPQSWQQDKDKPKAESKYGSSGDGKAAIDLSDRLFGSRASQEQFIQMQAMAQQERLLKATERNGNIQKMVVEHTGKTAAYTNATSKNTRQRFGKNPVGATTGNGDLAS